MIEADRVHSTPPTNTPIDTTRRRFLTVAAGASVASVGALTVGGMPAAAPVGVACSADPIFALIEAKRVADVAHEAACHALNEAERRYGFSSDEADAAWDAQGPACHAAHDACALMVSTPPTTFAGVLAVLRFANELQEQGIWIEDMDLERQLIVTTAQAIEAIIRQGGVA